MIKIADKSNHTQPPDSKGCCLSSMRNREISNTQKIHSCTVKTHTSVPTMTDWVLNIKFRGSRLRKCAAHASTHHSQVQGQCDCWERLRGGVPTASPSRAPRTPWAPSCRSQGEKPGSPSVVEKEGRLSKAAQPISSLVIPLMCQEPKIPVLDGFPIICNLVSSSIQRNFPRKYF